MAHVLRLFSPEEDIAAIQPRRPYEANRERMKTLMDVLRAHLKAELKRAGVGYAELASRLMEMGLPESEGSVTVKINRGAFPA